MQALKIVRSKSVKAAVHDRRPIVAVESVALRSGISPSRQDAFCEDVQQAVSQCGAVLAWLALVDGEVRIGLENDDLAAFLAKTDVAKISSRDLAWCAIRRGSGALTVAASLCVARLAGLSMVATGAIGGVHRDAPSDASADLFELARRGVHLVCAGIKPFLDIAATCERLEALGVPVYGLECDEMPLLYARRSGQPVDARFEDFTTLREAIVLHRAMTGQAALVAVPVAPEAALAEEQVEKWVKAALGKAGKAGISGAGATPFLVREMDSLSDGQTMAANEAAFRGAICTAAELALAAKTSSAC